MDTLRAQPAGRNQDTLQEAHFPADRGTTEGPASQLAEPCLRFVGALLICVEQLTWIVELVIFRSEVRSLGKITNRGAPFTNHGKKDLALVKQKSLCW